jgi:hypothetical protein
VVTVEPPAAPDTPAKAVGFYVSVIDGSRSGMLLGPYPSQPEASNHVDRARRAADKIDPWAGFYGFGTAKLTMKPGYELPEGKLNSRIGLHPDTAAKEDM